MSSAAESIPYGYAPFTKWETESLIRADSYQKGYVYPRISGGVEMEEPNSANIQAWDSNLRPPAPESRPLTNRAIGATS